MKNGALKALRSIPTLRPSLSIAKVQISLKHQTVEQLHYFHETQNTTLNVALKNIFQRNYQSVVNNHEVQTEIELFDLILSHLKSQNEQHPYIPTTLMLRYPNTTQSRYGV